MGRSHTLLFLLAFALLGSGCGNQPTPEQIRADAELAQAKEALVREDSRAAREHCAGALALDDALNRRARVAEETRMLGDLDAAGARFDSAFGWYARSQAEFRSLADRSGARDITLRVAGLRRTMGQEREALAMYVEALRLARVFHDDDGVMEIEWAMLPCARALDETDQEADIIRDLLQSYTAAGDVPHQAAVELASGDNHAAVRQFDKGAEDYLHALMLADQGGDSLLAVRTALRLAMSFESTGKLRDALTNYAECLRRADRTRGAFAPRLEALVRVGNLYLRGRQFDEASRFFRAAYASARAGADSLAQGYLLLQLGACNAESARDSALRLYRAGAAIFRSLDAPDGLAYASLATGTLLLRASQPTDALAYFRRGIDQSEAAAAPRAEDDLWLSCEQAYLGARSTPWYDETIDILLQLGRYEEAFWYADRRRSRELFSVLGVLDPRVRSDTLRALMDGFRDARARVIGAERRMLEMASGGNRDRAQATGAREECARAREAMQSAAEAVARCDRSCEPFVRVGSVSIADVQKVLTPARALVEPVLTRRSLYTFVVTGAKAGVYVAAFEKDRVFDLAREYADLLRQRQAYEDSADEQRAPLDARVKEIAPQLYEAFIAPIEGAVAGIAELDVVLPRDVASLPLQTLTRGGKRPGGYVAEQHALAYVPSAWSLLLRRRPGAAVQTVVGLGCPGSSGWDVEYELRDIRAFYKEVRLYFDQQATLGTLQRENEDLLHLALPIRFNDQRPGNSYVVLADSESPEILRHVPLGDLVSIAAPPAVVVSDLDQARLGVRPAEPYLFVAAGAQDVIFTSWVPTRKAKKYFGELFYTALLAGADVPGAFRKAELGMINAGEYSSPAIWGPFVLWQR